MSTPAVDAGSSPSPSSVPATPAPAAPAAPTVETPATPAAPASPAPAATAAKPSLTAVLSNLSEDQRMRLATGEDPATVFGVQAQPATPETPAETPAATPAEETPPVEATAPETPETPETPEQPETPEKVPDRFRFSNDDDKKIALLAKQLDVSLPEAVRIYEAAKKKGDEPTAAATTEPATPAKPAPPPEVAAIDAELTELDATITQAKADRKKAREDVDYDRADELSDNIAKAEAKRTHLVAERNQAFQRQERTAQRSFESKVSESANRVYEQFDSLKDADGADRLAFEGYIERAGRDPAKAKVFESPDWPEKLVKEFAAKTGLKPKGKAPATPAPAAPAPKPTLPPPTVKPPTPKPVTAQVPGAKLVTGPAGTNPAATRAKPTTTELLGGLRNMTEKQREQLIATADI